MTEDKRDGGPAFPRPSHPLHDPAPGMSLRDYFAGQFLAGLAANPRFADLIAGSMRDDETNGMCAARLPYEYADAMLAHRNKGREE